ncbi:MAG TPA: Hpt domain-containing protein [Terracidiphilus sp.]|nr:Hpt domain-containing protein [Terracidiphilus sp.]
MKPAQAELLAAAMDRLWKQHLPELEDRVAVLEAAATAAGAGTISDQLREEAHFAAHKLAGVLGTFGLAEGTDLAREAERFFSGSDEEGWISQERISQVPIQLRALMAARK